MSPADSGHELDLHKGQVLYRLANTYPTLLLTIVEAVQNAIDACAEKVFIGIDRRNLQVVILDDGLGVTEEKFQEALKSIGYGIKQKGSLGRFGLGLISPLNKCQQFIFISQPVGQSTANQWEFVGATIREQHREVIIPFRQLRGLPTVPQPFRAKARHLSTQWRTMIRIVNYTQDRVINTIDLDELEQDIRSKLGPEMRRRSTTVYVTIFNGPDQMTEREINPLEYSGKPLAVISYDDEEYCGRVTFELYRASRNDSKPRGEVVVMQTDDNYPIRWREFRMQAMGSGWLANIQEGFEALGSGFFEGIIRIENVELAPERNKFVLNDALRAAYIVIYRWFEDHGRKHYEDVQEVRREARYQRLGEQSLERLYQLVESNAVLAAVLPELTATSPPPRTKKGTATDDTKSKEPRCVAKHPTARSNKATTGEPVTNRHSPKPTLLSFGYEMLDSQRLWEFDFATATLTLNTRHPVWMMLDEASGKGKGTSRHDRWLMHLQEWLALKVLMLLATSTDPDDLEANRWPIDQEVRPYTVMFIHR